MSFILVCAEGWVYKRFYMSSGCLKCLNPKLIYTVKASQLELRHFFRIFPSLFLIQRSPSRNLYCCCCAGKTNAVLRVVPATWWYSHVINLPGLLAELFWQVSDLFAHVWQMMVRSVNRIVMLSILLEFWRSKLKFLFCLNLWYLVCMPVP